MKLLNWCSINSKLDRLTVNNVLNITVRIEDLNCDRSFFAVYCHCECHIDLGFSRVTYVYILLYDTIFSTCCYSLYEDLLKFLRMWSGQVVNRRRWWLERKGSCCLGTWCHRRGVHQWSLSSSARGIVLYYLLMT